MDVVVVAKEPRAGRVKTRLCPPCDPGTAATIAEAALRDTLEHAMASGADRVVLALDGRPGDWCPPGVDVVPQGDGSFSQRLARAWASVDGSAVQIGMDTPQVDGVAIAAALASLGAGGVDAVLGPADDGGWWLIGFRQPPDPATVFAGIPTSRPDTGRRQLARLDRLGYRVRTLDVRRDVDDWADARAVATEVPGSRFAAAVRAAESALTAAPGAAG